MIRHRSLLLALLGTLAFGSGLYAANPEPRVGDRVADFVFTDFTGNQHHLSDFADRYVLLDFWATWCRPCLKEVPELKAANKQFQSRGLVIIGLNSDKKLERALQFVHDNSITWLQASPPSTRAILKHSLKVEWYPTLILLGPKATILVVSKGDDAPLYGASLLKTLDQTLRRP